MPEEKVNILLVDDDPKKLLALESVLADLNQNLVRARSGEEALRCLLQNDFAVILLDVKMPGMDGLETAALIRQRERSARASIIFVTSAYREDVHALKGYSAGAVDYITTPIVPKILKAKVAVFVELYGKTLEVERQAEQLRGLHQEMESFSYSVSHDLRAPLRAISGFSQALAEDSADKLDQAGRHYLERILAGAQQMGQLIDALLALSRMTRGEMRRKPVDLSKLARTVCAQLREREPQRQVEVVIADGLAVSGDPGMLRAAVDNLLGNAWKFTSRREQARVEFGSTRAGEQTAYFVRDNGVGFDMAHAGRLFGAFQRLHRAEEFPGTGVGLATVQRIVHRHGGRVWAEGAPDKGATFYFTLGNGT